MREGGKKEVMREGGDLAGNSTQSSVGPKGNMRAVFHGRD